MAKYHLTQSAKDDVLAITIYTIETFGEPQAHIYHNGLEAAFQFIADNPEAARERTEINPPIRAHRYQAHMILYDINDNHEVVVLRVVHSASDWQ